MKICFVSSMHPPDDKRVFYKEALSLTEAGFDVAHICPGTPNEAGVREGVTTITYARPKGLADRVKQLFQLYKLAKRQKADAYHCNEVDSWGVGVVLRIFSGAKCVFDVHEHYPSTFAEGRFPKPVRPLVSGFVRAVFLILTPFTNKLVLAKRTVSDDFLFCDGKKVLVQNFSPATMIKFSGERVARAPGAPLTMVHLGLFNVRRGWPQTLEAMAKCGDNVRLQVIGTINDGSREDFLARATELRLADRVELHDWLPFEEAFTMLCKADIGLIAFQPYVQNFIFALPHKMFDYMAAGMAVLIPKQAVDIAPIVGETNCGLLIDPSDPDDMAAKIESLNSDPGLSFELGQNGQNAVREKLNWETESAKLINMYKEMSENL